MKAVQFLVFFTILSFLPALIWGNPDGGTTGLRLRTFVGMEPYGRMSSTGWGATDKRETWNVGYGISPGFELLLSLSRNTELGAGVRYQMNRRVFRDGGDTDERFGFIPLYVVGRFEMMDSGGINLYGTIRLGYALFLTSREYRDIYIDDAGALTDSSGGVYAGGSMGAVFNLVDRSGWKLDYSMDAGYSFHGASGRNASDKGYQINYQALSVDFALDWRF